MPAEQMALIRESLEEVGKTLTESNRRAAVIEAQLATQNANLIKVEEELPHFVRQRGFRNAVWSIVGGVVVAVGLLVVFVLWNRVDAKADARREDRQEKLASVSRAFANCEAVNRAFHGIDVGFTALAALSHAAQDTPEGHERIDTAHRALRQGLARSDCSGHLVGLSDADRDRVVAEARRSVPTLPLPPPPSR